MNQEEREIFLLHALLEESPAYASLTIPKDPQKRRQLLRSLLNVRSPMQVICLPVMSFILSDR